MKHILKTIIILAVVNIPALSQTCGFGCLGLSGIYGGYSVGEFKMEGLNEYLANLNPVNQFNFKKAEGFRVGANIFRAKYDAVFFSAKAYYQFMDTKSSLSVANNPSYDNIEYDLNMNNWGVSVDFGFPLFSLIDFKLVEGGVNFYSIKFTDTRTQNLATVLEKIYKTDKIQIGYYVGSGLVINLVQDYISIEGTAFYSFLKVKSLSNNSNTIGGVGSNLISDGGLGGILQLNLGLPL